MLLQIQSFCSHSLLPLCHPNLNANSKFRPLSHSRHGVRLISLKCSLSAVSEATQVGLSGNKPVTAEVCRTIMELSTVGTLSALTHDGWPLGIGVKFAVDEEGTPILSFSQQPSGQLSVDARSSLHVQLEQCGLRTPQCTIQGFLNKPMDSMYLKRLCSMWKKRFGEDPIADNLYVVGVERVLQMEHFDEVGIWVTLSTYKSANPDPLRDFAERIVTDINNNNLEDVQRFCNVYVELNFQVFEAKMIWVDRLGFDVCIYSPEGMYVTRIPFPREVMDEKGAKSTFNGMSQLAWEVEKNYVIPDFSKVTYLKQMKYGGRN